MYGKVKKTLYSLLLDEDVVRAVDQLAHRRGCSRSALVNQLLAEQLDLMTPERRIAEVLRAALPVLRYSLDFRFIWNIMILLILAMANFQMGKENVP